MNEEIMRVLKMVEAGKITADKAKELIDALGAEEANNEVIIPKKYEDKFLRIKVLSHDGDKVNVQLPIKIIKEVIRVTGKLPISTSIEGMENINLDDLRILANNDDDILTIKNAIYTLKENTTFCNLVSKIKEKRNDINHFGYKDSSVTDYNTLSHNLQEYYNEFLNIKDHIVLYS